VLSNTFTHKTLIFKNFLIKKTKTKKQTKKQTQTKKQKTNKQKNKQKNTSLAGLELCLLELRASTL